METAFGQQEKLAKLTLVCGLGEFGEQVIRQLREQLSVLPEALQCATRLVSVPSADPEAIKTEVGEARSTLTLIDNIDRIESDLDWEVDRQGGFLNVQHYVVGDLSALEDASSFVDAALDEHRLDTFTALGFCTRLREEAQTLSERNLASWSQVLIVSSKNRSGEEVRREAVQSTVAGLLLVSLLRGAPDTDGGATSFSTFGFAGYYGMAGPALHRLAEHAARRLVAEHRSEEAAGDTAPDPVAALVEDFAPRVLGRRLFDPALQPETTREGVPLATERIPAVPAWNGDTLDVSLDRGGLGLEVTEPGRETEWVARIRKHVRTFDMTVSYRWRRQLEMAADRLAQDIEDTFTDRFHALLGRFPYAPVYAERALNSLEEALQEARRPMEDRSGSLDDALGELRSAVAERPNVPVLSLRLALWVVPALVAGVWIINGLYAGPRGLIFPILFAVLNGGLAVGWLLWHVQKSRNRVQRARNRALEIVTERQAALLSENAVGSLRDTVLPALREAMSKAQASLESHRHALQGADDALRSSSEKALPTPITFEPVLATPEEYALALQRSGYDARTWLRDAVADEIFSSDTQADALREGLAAWCLQRLRERVEDHDVLDHTELWEIRQQCRGDDDLIDSIDALWRLATPLADGRYAPDVAEEAQAVLVPDGLGLAIRDGADVDFPRDRIEEIETVPLLCCLRAGLLSNLKRSAL